MTKRKLTGLAGLTLAAGLVLSGCAGGGASDEPIVVGSQAYYSNEIIAEIYAQALEGAGFEVERQFQIGQRDAYLPELESGAVDLFPECRKPFAVLLSRDHSNPSR